MSRRFSEIAFPRSVQIQQTRRGSRAAYAAVEGGDDGAAADLMGMREFAFIDARDSFYLATVSETGWPYVQHRSGPPGFVRRLSERSIGWAEYIGNRQYVSAGNTAVDDRVSIIFVDYPHRERLKLLGHMHGYEVGERPDLAEALAVGRYRARVERFVVVTVEGFDWNCPQHITPRFTLAEVEKLAAPLHERIAELEAQLGGHEHFFG